MIEATHIYKAYDGGKTQVVKDVSLTVRDGEFVVLLGASGSGKSTLLHLLSGLDTADDGAVCVDGRDLGAMTEAERTKFRRDNVGFIFQQYYLLPHVNADANVKMGASLAGNTEYRDILVSLGLGDKGNAMPHELSGGEQQRVCIARALAKKPKYLFLDEPTGALDEATGREVLDYILKERQTYGFTTVMVTHNSHIAETAETVCKLNSGRIVETVANPVQKSAYEIGW